MSIMIVVPSLLKDYILLPPPFTPPILTPTTPKKWDFNIGSVTTAFPLVLAVFLQHVTIYVNISRETDSFEWTVDGMSMTLNYIYMVTTFDKVLRMCIRMIV